MANLSKYKKLQQSLRSFFYRIQKKLDEFSMPDYTLFSIFAIITGVLVGLGAVLFHTTIHFFTEVFFLYGSKPFVWLGLTAVILIPVLGMIIQSIMIYFSPKAAGAKGVPEVIKSVAIRGGYIPFKTTIFHFFAPAICIGSGGTVGPEGPAAQLGGGIASKLGQLFSLSDSRRRMFTAAGAGAAISAVFNTPLAGVFFALEIILLNEFQTATFSALILASVSASAVSRIFLGNSPAFSFDAADVGPYEYFYLFIILGILAGFISLVYIRYSDSVEQLFKNNFVKRLPKWLLMSVVGLAVGVSGYFYPEIFGIGYKAINHVLADTMAWEIAVTLLIMKFILVPLILSSGGFGGVFAPSLFIGAMFGYVFAVSLEYFWGLQVDKTTYVLVSMGAVLGGVNSIPITAILIIFEMTKDYSFILPLMLAVIISTTISQLVLKGSVHVKHLERQGYHISRGREESILKSVLVKNVMKEDISTVREDTTLPDLISEILDSPHSTIYTINNEDRLSGTITENEIRPIITEYDILKSMVVARDIARPEVITVNDDDNLDYVFKLFGNSRLDQFPVVSAADPDNVLGTVRRQDVMTAYNRETLKYNLSDGMAGEFKTIKKHTSSKVAEGYSIVEKNTPPGFLGKTLIELRIRNEYGVEVLMIKHRKDRFIEGDDEIIIPDANYKIQLGDRLVLFGSDDNINKITNW
jgi:CIC family chloride channel protein